MIGYQMETLLGRIKNIHNLQTKPNREKKVALIYYSYPPGKENIGASYLNVLPRSILSILQRMRQEGYDTGGQPIDSAAIFNRVMDYGRNIGSWAPAEVDKLVRKGDPVLVPMEVYKEWYDKLSLKIRTEMENKWGKPEESELMVWKDSFRETLFCDPGGEIRKYHTDTSTSPGMGRQCEEFISRSSGSSPSSVSGLLSFFEVWLSRRCTGAYRYSRHA